MRFYKSDEIYTENFEEKINLALKGKKYFIFHQGGKEWHLANPSANKENEQINIKGNLEGVGNLEAEMTRRLIKKNLAYSSRFGKNNKATHQIHLYSNNAQINENEISVPLSSVTKIVDYNTAQGATVASHVAMTLLLPNILIAFIFR
ncbi:MAG: hypothetical protein V4683_05025 [Bacteroidota bacterium]